LNSRQARLPDGQANQKSKIKNQKFAIINQKCLELSVWRLAFWQASASVVPPFHFSLFIIGTQAFVQPKRFASRLCVFAVQTSKPQTSKL
jgi:hypothetical protein